jgi:hypothetical protein
MPDVEERDGADDLDLDVGQLGYEAVRVPARRLRR